MRACTEQPEWHRCDARNVRWKQPNSLAMEGYASFAERCDPQIAVASPISVKLYLLHVPLPGKNNTTHSGGVIFVAAAAQDANPSKGLCGSFPIV